MNDNKREFEQLPNWLKECWKLSPAIAREAEKYVEELKPLSSHAVLGEGPTMDQIKDLLLQLQRAGIYTLTDKAFGDKRYDELKIEIIEKWIVGLSS